MNLKRLCKHEFMFLARVSSGTKRDHNILAHSRVPATWNDACRAVCVSAQEYRVLSVCQNAHAMLNTCVQVAVHTVSISDVGVKLCMNVYTCMYTLVSVYRHIVWSLEGGANSLPRRAAATRTLSHHATGAALRCSLTIPQGQHSASLTTPQFLTLISILT